jgi:hypothetical protein
MSKAQELVISCRVNNPDFLQAKNYLVALSKSSESGSRLRLGLKLFLDRSPEEVSMPKRSRIMSSLAAVVALAICSWFNQAAAQSTKERKGQTVTITGCVQKGEAADEFAITQNGKKYGLKSTKVRLADHLGHQVTVTGKITGTPGQGEKGDKEEEGGEYADVQVTSLHMISTTCQ